MNRNLTTYKSSNSNACKGFLTYRFSFNGQEKDDEIYGEGNALSATFWEYDARIGRRWNLDPKPKSCVSNYLAYSNNPIIMIDPNGDADYYNKKGVWIGTDGVDDKKIYVATQSSTVKIIKEATKNNMYTSSTINLNRDVLEIPDFNTREEIMKSYKATDESGRENGGHVLQNGDPTHWDEGGEVKTKVLYDEATNSVSYNHEASIQPFKVGGELKMPKISDVKVMWHIHPKHTIIAKNKKGEEVDRIETGSSSPSKMSKDGNGDIPYVKAAEQSGFSGDAIIVGEGDQKVNYYDSNGSRGNIKKEVFNSVGSKKEGKLYENFKAPKK